MSVQHLGLKGLHVPGYHMSARSQAEPLYGLVTMSVQKGLTDVMDCLFTRRQLLAAMTCATGVFLVGCNNRDNVIQNFSPNAAGATGEDTSATTTGGGASAKPSGPVAYPTVRPNLTISRRMDAILQALTLETTRVPQATHWVELRFMRRGSLECQPVLQEFPYQQDRNYAPVNWLAAAGFQCSWDEDRQILELRNRDAPEGLFLVANQPYAIYLRADSKTQYGNTLSEWRGVNALNEPIAEPIAIKSAPIDIAHDPMLTLRAVLAPFGCQYADVKQHPHKGDFTEGNPAIITICMDRVALSAKEIFRRSKRPEAYHAPDHIPFLT